MCATLFRCGHILFTWKTHCGSKFHFGKFGRSEICTEMGFNTPEFMWTRIMKLPHTEVKSQTILSSRRVSCKRIRSFVHERALIITTLISSCHWETLVPFWSRKRIFNTNSELSQNSIERQMMPSKTTINWKFSDIWCYLFIASFDWKIGVFQHTFGRIYYIFNNNKNSANTGSSVNLETPLNCSLLFNQFIDLSLDSINKNPENMINCKHYDNDGIQKLKLNQTLSLFLYFMLMVQSQVWHNFR